MSNPYNVNQVNPNRWSSSTLLLPPAPAQVIEEYIKAGVERGDTEPHIFSVGKEVHRSLTLTIISNPIMGFNPRSKKRECSVLLLTQFPNPDKNAPSPNPTLTKKGRTDEYL